MAKIGKWQHGLIQRLRLRNNPKKAEAYLEAAKNKFDKDGDMSDFMLSVSNLIDSGHKINPMEIWCRKLEEISIEKTHNIGMFYLGTEFIGKRHPLAEFIFQKLKFIPISAYRVKKDEDEYGNFCYVGLSPEFDPVEDVFIVDGFSGGDIPTYDIILTWESREFVVNAAKRPHQLCIVKNPDFGNT